MFRKKYIVFWPGFLPLLKWYVKYINIRGGRASKSSGIERARASDDRAHSSSSKLEHQMIEHIQVRANIEHQILKKILVFWSLE